ncbi:MAG: hypothetical protein ACOYL6_18975 [Bacteriovoracaceae bacterium]
MKILNLILLLFSFLFCTSLSAQNLIEAPLVSYQDYGDFYATFEEDRVLKVFNKKKELVFFHTFEAKQKAKLIKLNGAANQVFILGKDQDIQLFDLNSRTLASAKLSMDEVPTAMTKMGENTYLIGSDAGAVYQVEFDQEAQAFKEEVLKLYEVDGESINEIKVSSDGKLIYFNHSMQSGPIIGFSYSSDLPGDHIGKAYPMGFKPDLSEPTGHKGQLGFSQNNTTVFDEEKLARDQKTVASKLANSSRAQKGVFIQVKDNGDFKLLLKISGFSSISISESFEDIFYASKGAEADVLHLNLANIIAHPEAELVPDVVTENSADFLKLKKNTLYIADADKGSVIKMNIKTQKAVQIDLPSNVRQIIEQKGSMIAVLENGQLHNLDKKADVKELGKKLTRNVDLVQIGDEFFFRDFSGKRLGINLNPNCEGYFLK